MNNAVNTYDDRPDDEQPANAFSQCLADSEPLSRAGFDRIRSAFVRTVGNPVDHPTEGRNVHLRKAEAEAFGQFASENGVTLVELDEDTRYGNLHGYPVVGGTGWVPILATTDDSGGVGGAARRIHESHQALGNTTTSTTADRPHENTLVTDGGTTLAESESQNVLNEDALVGLAADEEELSWRYKSTLAPDSFKDHIDSGEVDGECAKIDDGYYTQTLKVRDWPAKPRRGFFDKIVSLSMPKVDITLSTHLTGEDKRDADRDLSEASDSLKQKISSFAKNKWLPDYFTEKAVEDYADIKRTQNTVAASEYGLYTSHTYIEVRAPDQDRLNTAVKRIRSRMQDVSADARKLKYHSKLGYQTAAPACKDYIGGQTKMTGDGLSRLMPWTARNLMESGGIELGINEDTGDPLILDLQNRDTGFNVGIWGTIGSGKTTTVTRLLMRLKMRNPEMPLVIIGPKQEFAGFTWLFDGQTVKIGSDTGINPLQIEETPPENLDNEDDEGPYRNAVRRAMDFVRSFYEYQGLPFEDVQDTWRDAIKEAYRRQGIKKDPNTHSNDSPTLKDDVFPILLEMLNSPENFVHDGAEGVDRSVKGMEQRADDIIHKHTGALQEGGEFEHLSMETSIDINNIDVLYLDLQNYENEVTAGLMMGPLLTSVLEQAKEIDEPMALAMDEFHYMLHNSSSLETLKQAYRHSRHSDLSMITATQSVEEFFTKNEAGERQLTDDASTLTKLMSVKIWHYLEEMNDEWAGEFDMSEAEQKHIEDAATGDPTAQALLQLQQGGSYRLSVDFSDKLNPREFAANQYDPTDHGTDPLAYLDDYTDRDGRDVTEWTWPAMTETGQPAEASADSPTELADGTTVTADVSDVDAVPTDGPDTSEQPSEDPSADDMGSDESDPSDAEVESDGAAEEESAGFASRVKSSVSSAVGRNDDQDPTEADERPELADIHGTVTVQMAGNLRDAGYESVEDVFEADNTALAEIKGIDPTKAAFLRRQAAKRLDRSASIVESPPESTGTDVETNDTETNGPETDTSEIPEPAESAVRRVEESSQSPESFADAETATQAATTESDGDDGSDGSAGVLGRMKGGLSSVFPHPAAGKAHPDLTDIGIVGEEKAAALRAAGFETVEEIYTAETGALTEAETIDEVHADVVRTSAKRTLDASDAPVPDEGKQIGEGDTVTAHDRETAESAGETDGDHNGPGTAALDESAAATGSSPDRQDPTGRPEHDDVDQPDVTDIQHVGEDRADVLREAGYESIADVAAADQTTLTEVEGIGNTRAAQITASANDLLGQLSESTVADAAGGDV